MKRFLIIPAFLISIQYIHVYSQYTPGELYNNWKTLAIRQTSNEIIYEYIEGSPYYNDEFINGIVYLIDGRNTSISLRYDLYQDEIEFMKGDSILWLPKQFVKFVRYGSEMLFVGTTDKKKPGFLFIKEAGNYSLFVKKKVNFYPEIPAKGYSATVPERFLPEKDEFYLKKKDQSAKKITNNRSLLSILRNNKHAITYIRKENIKADNIDDLRKLVSFLNTQEDK